MATRVAFVGSADSPPPTQSIFRGFARKCLEWTEDNKEVTEFVFTGRPGWDFATVWVCEQMKRKGRPCRLIVYAAVVDLGPFLTEIALMPQWNPEPEEIANPNGLFASTRDSFEAAMHAMGDGVVVIHAVPPSCWEWKFGLSVVSQLDEIIHAPWRPAAPAVGKKRAVADIY